MKRKYLAVIPLALLLFIVLAPNAIADSTDLQNAIDGKLEQSVGINSIWVILAGSLVMFMVGDRVHDRVQRTAWKRGRAPGRCLLHGPRSVCDDGRWRDVIPPGLPGDVAL